MEGTFDSKAMVTKEGILIVSGLDKILRGGEWKKPDSDKTVELVLNHDFNENRICILRNKKQLHPFEKSKTLT